MTDINSDSLHLKVFREEDQWIAACLDFDLAAQADTAEEAVRKLLKQVDSYIEAAQEMADPDDTRRLLGRKAPMAEWLRPVGPLEAVVEGFASIGAGFVSMFRPSASVAFHRAPRSDKSSLARDWSSLARDWQAVIGDWRARRDTDSR